LLDFLLSFSDSFGETWPPFSRRNNLNEPNDLHLVLLPFVAQVNQFGVQFRVATHQFIPEPFDGMIDNFVTKHCFLQSREKALFQIVTTN
jgi:hypothetical protein